MALARATAEKGETGEHKKSSEGNHAGAILSVVAAADAAFLCGKVFGILQNPKVLMFSSFNLSDDYKGGDLLAEALKGLPAPLKSRTLLLMLGNRREAMSPVVGIRVLKLGYTASDHLKAIATSAADLFVLPTRAGNFALVLLESLRPAAHRSSLSALGAFPE